MKVNIHEALAQRQSDNLGELFIANPDLDLRIKVDSRGHGDEGIKTLAQRVAHMAPLRQGMVDDYLQDASYVLWIDADVLKYDPKIATKLVRRSEGNVVAPAVLLDGQQSRFYDIAGFIEKGNRCELHHPWFEQEGDAELDSVGTFYLVPAELYRLGAKHEYSPTYTEHYSVCQFARELGRKVICLQDLLVYHADLRNYGEGWH